MVKKIYIHRVNTIDLMNSVPKSYGLEIDLRSEGDKIIIHHNPFESGPTFEAFLKHYSHNGLILNCKTEGIEAKILKLLKSYGVNDFFFLDLSVPFLIKTYKSGCRKIAARFSEHEPLEFAKKFKEKCEWVWIDSFSGEYFEAMDLMVLSKFFKICIVSPEIRGFDLEIIQSLKTRYDGINIDAVCTKNPELWKS